MQDVRDPNDEQSPLWVYCRSPTQRGPTPSNGSRAQGSEDTSPGVGRPRTHSLQSLWISVDGEVMTKSDWTNLSKEVRKSYLQLVVQAQTEIELANGLETWAAWWRHPVYRGVLDAVVELGLRTTSRLEALHASLRSYVGDRSRRRRLGVHELVIFSLDKFHAQWAELRTKMDYEISHRPSENAHTLFHAVRTVVAEYAINKLKNQVGIARNIVKRAHGERRHPDGRPIPETRPCTGQFRTSMGLPCAHTIAEVMDTANGGSGVLEASHFSPHWWLSSTTWMQSILEAVDLAVANANGLDQVETIDVRGARRLRDPVTAVARREAGEAVSASQRSRRASQRSGPATSSGRLLTQAEIADGGPEEPETPLCRTCRRRHQPENPCRETLDARAAVQRSQERAEDPEDLDDDPYDYDSDYDDVHPRSTLGVGVNACIPGASGTTIASAVGPVDRILVPPRGLKQ
ncbi:hypothetical protein A1Q2_03547 [Trichosporon asahii var. asahii CBS 8904]|uniref:SWIM-type domain-containing protein n=1 Tax=Trichosporon asahii var. asahii (strain CBS 8904) TaxID=1220162 RepID=K1VDY9_TRIAC|nr:hypothetical protein A1Q2_03547 [Trichosporon asahii var. asahii CBS 8904]